MKKKIVISCESGFDADGYPAKKPIKTFKNEPEALAFYNDRRNIRRYGAMFMSKTDEDGSVRAWDDAHEAWVTY